MSDLQISVDSVKSAEPWSLGHFSVSMQQEQSWASINSVAEASWDEYTTPDSGTMRPSAPHC